MNLKRMIFRNYKEKGKVWFYAKIKEYYNYNIDVFPYIFFADESLFLV